MLGARRRAPPTRSRSPVTIEAHRGPKRTEPFHPTNEAPLPKRTEPFHRSKKGPPARLPPPPKNQKKSADKPRKRITQTIKSLFSGSFAAVHQPRHHHTNNVKHKEDFHRASRRTGQLQRRTKRFRDKEPADGANRRNKAQRRRRVGR